MRFTALWVLCGKDMFWRSSVVYKFKLLIYFLPSTFSQIVREHSKPNDVVLALGDGPGTGAIAAMRERRYVNRSLTSSCYYLVSVCAFL